MRRIDIIQLFIFFLAAAAAIGCAVLSIVKVHGSLGRYYVDNQNIAVPLEVDSGLNGSATGLGIISAACFLGFVWIEITKFKSKNN